MQAASMTVVQRQNFRHLYLDILWWGILAGSTIALVSVYLVRLGASTFQLALLAAGPALINLFFSIPAGHWLKNRDLRITTFWTSILFRGGYLLLIFLPNLLPSQSSQLWTVILVYLIAAIPGTILAISFNALFAELVEPAWRPYVVGRRNAILALSITVTSLVVSYLLEEISFPLNYQVVFAIGFIGAALSSWNLFKFKPADGPHPNGTSAIHDRAGMVMQRDGDVVRRPAGLRFLARLDTTRWLRLDLVRGPFGYFLAAYLFFYIAQYLPTPLFPVYLVDELGISESVISIGGALFYLGVMVVSLALNRLNNRYGRQSLLTFGVIAYAVFPITISLFGSVGSILIAHALGGLSWGFAGTGTLNNLMDKVPEHDRPAHMALNHIVMNVGILAGSFLGPVLGDMVGIRTAILAAGILRIFAGLLVGRWA